MKVLLAFIVFQYVQHAQIFTYNLQFLLLLPADGP